MYRLTLLLALLASPAHADPITLSVAALAASAAVSVSGLTGIALALAQLAVGIGFSLLGAELQKNKARGQADLKRELARPDSLPVYRYVWGHTRTYGTPWPWYVKGDVLYGALLFNSRPSKGNFRVFFDKREMTISGDPYDLNGAGATGTEDDFKGGIVRMWIGRGDQVSPPKAFTEECPEKFKTTDGWRNLTMGFFRLDCGDNESRAERWPSTPPAIELEGDWSLVWNPLDASQDASNPATWKYSANRTLCVLDALRWNPVRRFRLASLMIDTFRVSTTIDAERVALKAGGTEARYETNGLLTWDDSEIEDQIAPLVEAGAGGITRVGGRLGMIPGAWQEPTIVLRDILADDGLTFDVLKPGADLATEVRGSYIAPDREWEKADAGSYVVPGAVDIDGGESTVKTVEFSMVTSPTQAQRLLKIMAMLQRAQRSISAVFPPSAFNAVGGSNVRLDLPAPYAAMNRAYRVETTHPAMDITGEGGVSLRNPMSIVETSADIYAWNPETDEQEVEKAEPIIATRKDLPQPGGIQTGTGSAYAASSGADRARIKFWFSPLKSGRISAYEWQFRESGGSWQAGGTIDAGVRDNGGFVFGYLRPVEQGVSYDIRIRSRDGNSASVWTFRNNTVALGPSVALNPPTPVSVTINGGGFNVAFRLPGDDDVIGLELWASAVNSATAASKIASVSGAGSSTITLSHGGLGATTYYWGKTRGPYGSVSALSASIQAIH